MFRVVGLACEAIHPGWILPEAAGRHSVSAIFVRRRHWGVRHRFW